MSDTSPAPDPDATEAPEPDRPPIAEPGEPSRSDVESAPALQPRKGGPETTA